MKKIIVIASVLLIVASSCVKQSSEYKRLKAENDSLALAQALIQADLDETMLVINEVQDGFSAIKSAESYLAVQANAQGEVTSEVRERLANDMKLIAETLKSNRTHIEKLERQLKNSNYNTAQLMKTIDRLNAEIDAKMQTITELEAALAKRDVRIEELSTLVTEYGEKINTLDQTVDTQQSTLDQQDKNLHAVWYAYGSKAELKKEKIITGGGLFKSADVMKSDFNKAFFTEGDMRQLKEIFTNAKKVKLLSTHPTGSYEIKKDEQGKITVTITDPEKFWSLTHYLVIQND